VDKTSRVFSAGVLLEKRKILLTPGKRKRKSENEKDGMKSDVFVDENKVFFDIRETKKKRK